MSGAAVADPSEVLASQVTEDIIKEAKKNFDFVIIDCPPAGVLADATIVANYCDAVLFVVAENKPSLREIEYAISDLSTTKADIFGCVYNIASRSIISNITRSSYFNKYYGAYYGQDLTQRKR